jgi:hypothetical protein
VWIERGSVERAAIQPIQDGVGDQRVQMGWLPGLDACSDQACRGVFTW